MEGVGSDHAGSVERADNRTAIAVVAPGVGGGSCSHATYGPRRHNEGSGKGSCKQPQHDLKQSS